MKVVEFYLQGKDKIFNQVIIGGSIIEIKIIIEGYNGEAVFLDISNYSKKGIFQIFPKETFDIDCIFNELIEVEFIGQEGILCKKNDLNSRVKIVVNGTSYYSNPIGDYKYIDSVFLENSSFYKKGDHHLGVYNKYGDNYKDKLLEITEIDKYPNDIIFINRKYSYVKNIFIDLNNDIKIIFYKYKINLLKKEKSIFFIDFFGDNSKYPIEKIKKILLLCNRNTFYFYNISPCYLISEGVFFIQNNLLYDYHFKPIIDKKKMKGEFDCKECLYFDLCNWKKLD